MVMTDKRTQQQSAESNMQKPPESWTTGDEPMTGAQRSYLMTLCEEAKVPFDGNLSKAQASTRIAELQNITGRGLAQKDTEEQTIESGETEADAQGRNLRGVADR
jgi:hypothetical protein